MSEINMTAFGLSDRYTVFAHEYNENYTIGRILSQEKGLYRIISENGEQFAEVSGKFRYNAASAQDFPAVGDFVMADRSSLRDHTIIHGVLPRKSVFVRKAAGTGNAGQVVAANIDTVFICMALNNDFNLRRLERYLAVAWDSGAVPVIVLTKSDLCYDVQGALRSVESVAVGTDIVVTSAIGQNGYKKLLPYIRAGETVALIGSSGVGKSTLINRLLGEESLATNGLRNDGKGRHTTTRRELLMLEGGGMVIDTPGMRELGLWETDAGLEQSFQDIEELAAMCRFHDCSHESEPGCAVREAIENGEISTERLQSYRKLKKENRYADDPGQYSEEKKQKFKTIAKINKRNRPE